MANLADVKTNLAKTETKTLQQMIQESAKELGKALPEGMRPERLVRIALTCIRQNPDLAECTPASFLGALFTAAQMGLEPVAGQAYLLPFWNSRKKSNGEWHKVREVQFLVGYKGMASLFYRHEKAVELAWGEVRENDDFVYQYGTDAQLKHIPAIKNRGDAIGYYVVAKLNNGGRPFMFMSKDDCLAHAKQHSKTWDAKKGEFYPSSPWVTSQDSMCLKTVLIQLAKLLPISVELQRAIQADESSRDYRKGIESALDMPETTDWSTKQVIDAESIGNAKEVAKNEEIAFGDTHDKEKVK